MIYSKNVGRIRLEDKNDVYIYLYIYFSLLILYNYVLERKLRKDDRIKVKL